MGSIFDFLNPDSTEVEEQRVIRVAGTAGDVLTVQADGTIDPAPGGGSLPWLSSGDGSPIGVVTPDPVFLYVDTTNGGLYAAIGTTSLDWLALGGVPGNIGEATGLVFNKNNVRDAYLLPGDRDVESSGTMWTLTDAFNFWNGTGGAGLKWVANGTDGEQTLQVQNSAGNVELINQAGALDLTNAKGIIFPDTDPHVVDAWWNNAGTLTKSSG